MNVKINSPLRGNIRKMLRSPKANPFPGVIGTFMGRDALSVAVSSLDLSANDTVLLPAYLCREVLKPFLGKTRVEFYDIQPDLTVDPREIELMLERNKARMMMIINYFGFLQPYRKEIKDICSERGIILTEDCAHSLLTEGSGETGDFSIYSFRKILPVSDGGGLKINGQGKAVNPNFYPKIYSNFLSFFATVKSLLSVRSETLSRAGLSSQKKKLLGNSNLNNKVIRILPLSSFAQNSIGNIIFSEIIERRRIYFQYWQEVAEKTNLFTPVFRSLPSGVCPFGFPVMVKDRDLLKWQLQKEGIAPQIHWHLPVEVGKNFVNSHELSAHTLTLPVYPESGRRERERIERLLTS